MKLRNCSVLAQSEGFLSTDKTFRIVPSARERPAESGVKSRTSFGKDARPPTFASLCAAADTTTAVVTRTVPAVSGVGSLHFLGPLGN